MKSTWISVCVDLRGYDKGRGSEMVKQGSKL